MSTDRRHPPTQSGASSSVTSQAPALEPVAPLPRPIGEPDPSGAPDSSRAFVPSGAFVPPGSYGMSKAYVPVTPYVPPLPPGIDENTPSSALRVVTEDPLAFLAKQAAAHDGGPSSPPAAIEPVRRFVSKMERDAPAGPQRRTSVPPPGFR